ncbi:MAG: DUF4097 domain-containing protein [Halanaerobiales bacterium]|nr:DUF4097 domain-containing protein [Halanaerobiales bacterium]
MKRKRVVALILIALVVIMVIDFRMNDENTVADFFIQFETDSMSEINQFSEINTERQEPSAIRKSNLSYSSESIEELILDNEVGSIDIEGHDSNKIDVTYEVKIYSANKEAAENYLKEISVGYNVSGGEFKLYVNRPKPKPDNIKGVEVLFDIKAPNDIYLDLANRYGEVNVQNFNAGLNLDTRYSETTVNFVEGKMNIRNDYGSLTLSDLEGNLTINTSYNKNDFKNIQGNLDLKTGYAQSTLENINADTVLTGKYGGADIEKLNGNLDIDVRYMGITLDDIKGEIDGEVEYGEVNIESLSNSLNMNSRYADLKIWMVKDLQDLNVDVTTEYGNLKTDFDLSRSQDGNKKSIKGTLGTGNKELNIEARHADVSIIYEN